ncbi:cellulose biosynthesis protein BcsE [Enterobacteriaceae bacterium H18W14]|uniref:cellulose biosynthesis protein BcsE n=1 Tax=Dryocola boscaweniae TaxID=2925397 RepID=UPI0022F0CA67|nr:cellulose biosynthesis protein BcsE [Dryocola boscaweniae]MCT4715718.1 cellulose biosynthesis protein BcsE [Dryocola boscaweniae]
MEPIFSVGIRSLWDELRHMPAGGVWWLNIDRREDAITLLNQTIASQNSHAKTAIITMGAQAKDIVKLDGDHGPKKVNLFNMPNSQNSLNFLRRDLMCNINPENYFFILLGADNVWENISAEELCKWLLNISKWTQRYKCTFLFLNVGNNSDKQRSLLVSEHRILNGLASLRYQGDIHHYDIAFWCNEKGVSARQQLDVRWTNNGWQRVETTETVVQPRSDEKQILSHIAVLEGAPPFSEYWQTFDTNEALFQAARTAQVATVIFLLSQNNQIDSLARQIHALRRQRGSALKIIVRENTASLRTTDERLLLGCGATLVISWNAPLSRSLMMIESVQGTQFSRHVPEDINILIDQMQPLKLRGYQPWDVFCRAISSLMDNALLPQDGKGVMVALRPVPGYRSEQALTLCHTNRLGDIVTLSDNRVVLFLSFCRINDLDTALRHIFPLPVGDIFSNRMVWYEDSQIAAEIVQMQAMNPEKWVKPLAVSVEISEARNVKRGGEIVRRVPVPVTLLKASKGERAQ